MNICDAIIKRLALKNDTESSIFECFLQSNVSRYTREILTSPLRVFIVMRIRIVFIDRI